MQILLVLWLGFSNAFAQAPRDFSVPLQPADTLQISLPRAQINLRAETGSALTIKWRRQVGDRASAAAKKILEKLTLHVSREGNRVILEPEGVVDAREWLELANSEGTELILDLGVPVANIQIGMKAGSVRATGLQQNVEVMLTKGFVQFTRSTGDLKLTVQKGEVKVEGHKGLVRAATTDAKVSVAQHEGDLDLYLQNGECTVAGLNGGLIFVSGNASAQLSKTVGKADVQLRRGSFSLNGHEGSLRLKTEDAAVNVQLLGTADTVVDAKSASVSIKAPERSGAYVRLQSDEGAINAPDVLQSSRAGEARVYSGRLKGDEKGSIQAKSINGSIRLRL